MSILYKQCEGYCKDYHVAGKRCTECHPPSEPTQNQMVDNYLALNAFPIDSPSCHVALVSACGCGCYLCQQGVCDE